MDPPELTNFGSLVRFAIELEASASGFYADAERLLDPGPHTRLAQALAGQHESRRRLLERTRQQKLNEMLLEPITGLDGHRYLFDAEVASRDRLPQKAMALEQVAARFYAESSAVAKSLLTEAARTFRKLAEENLQNLSLLRATFPV